MHTHPINTNIWAGRFFYHPRVLSEGSQRYYNGYDTCDKGGAMLITSIMSEMVIDRSKKLITSTQFF